MLGVASVRGAQSTVILPELWLQLSLVLHSHNVARLSPKRSRSYTQVCLNTRIKLCKLGISWPAESHQRDQNILSELERHWGIPRNWWKGLQQNLESTFEDRPWVMIQAISWTKALMLCVCVRTANLIVLGHYRFASLKHQPQSTWGGLSGINSLGSSMSWRVHFVPRNATALQSRKGLDCVHCEDELLGHKKHW